MRFSRQEYWSGLPLSTPGDLPEPGIEPTSPALAGRFFTTGYGAPGGPSPPAARPRAVPTHSSPSLPHTSGADAWKDCCLGWAQGLGLLSLWLCFCCLCCLWSNRPQSPVGGGATPTGSLASQRHPGKFPKVPGRRRGTRGFPAASNFLVRPASS